MTTSDEAKVVQVLNDFELVINAGSSSGVKRGQLVRVYTLGDMIVDPDTKEDLEPLEIVRGTGKVTNVQKKISTVRSNETYRAPTTIKKTTGSPGNITSLFGSTVVEETSGPSEAPFKSPQIGDRVTFV